MVPCLLFKKWGLLSRSEVALLMVLAWPSASLATNIYYSVSNISGNQWQYDYTVQNNSFTDNLQEFTIYFELGLYENLTTVSAPTGWDPLVVQPDPGLPSDGFYDALELGSGLSPGSLSGPFSVSFNYLGFGTPSFQRFDTYKDANLILLDSSYTAVGGGSEISEPGTLTMLALGLLAGLIYRLRRPNYL